MLLEPRRHMEGRADHRGQPLRGLPQPAYHHQARVQPHAEVEEALLKKAGGEDLFEDRTARLARAYQAREKAMKR